jgi:hypothetical protein
MARISPSGTRAGHRSPRVPSNRRNRHSRVLPIFIGIELLMCFALIADSVLALARRLVEAARTPPFAKGFFTYS